MSPWLCLSVRFIQPGTERIGASRCCANGCTIGCTARCTNGNISGCTPVDGTLTPIAT